MQGLSHLRQGVVGVFIDKQKKVLTCKRSDSLNAWQFPQGGIDFGESPRVAIEREMQEELGVKSFSVLEETKDWYSYELPPKLAEKASFRGQTQKWFLLRFDENAQPNLSSSDGEFVDFKWVSAAVALSEIIDWKKEAYHKALTNLGLLEKVE